MEYDIMKDLRRIIRRRSKGESPQARHDRLVYYSDKWYSAYCSNDPALRMCAVLILAALDAPEELKAWQASEHFINTLMDLVGKSIRAYHTTDPE